MGINPIRGLLPNNLKTNTMSNYYFYNHRYFITFLLEVVKRFKTLYWSQKDEDGEIKSKYETNLDRFKDEVIWPYSNFIYSLNNIPVPSHLSKLQKQLKFSDNCKRLIEIYKNEGYEKVFEEQKNYDKFVIILQDHLSEYIDDNLELVLKEIERQHFTDNAFNGKQSVPSSFKNSALERAKEEMMQNLKKVDFGV